MAEEARVPITEAVSGDPGRRTSATAALRYRDFRLFWIGMVVSNVGSWMQLYALGYLVVQLAIRDGVPQLAPFYIGVLGLARALPSLAFGLFGGVVADRADRRKLLLLTQVAATLNALAIAILTITERINIVEVVVIGAIGSIIFSFDAPTRQAMVPRLVRDRDLVSAIGLNSVAFNGAQLAGPVLGGILYIPFGLGGLFMINALSFSAVIAALILMAPVPAAARQRDVTVLRSIREGLGYVRHDVVVRWIIILTAAAALLTRPWIQLLPAFTEQILRVGAVELSWLMGASGFGALGGALVTASLGNLRRRGAHPGDQRLRHGGAGRGVRAAALAAHRASAPCAGGLRDDAVHGYGEHARADANARSPAGTRDERAHDGVPRGHAPWDALPRCARHGRGGRRRALRRRACRPRAGPLRSGARGAAARCGRYLAERACAGAVSRVGVASARFGRPLVAKQWAQIIAWFSPASWM